MLFFKKVGKKNFWTFFTRNENDFFNASTFNQIMS